MKIHIINYEMNYGIDSILSKYARMLERELIDLGHVVSVSGKAEKADINHHINFNSYKPSGGKDSMMIAHISGDKKQTKAVKIKQIKKGLKTAHGIAMNPGIMKDLIKEGCDPKKLDYVMHAHDEHIRRPKIVAVVSKNYEDDRKNPEMFTELVKSLKDKKSVIFRIMGAGWFKVLKKLEKVIQVQYTDQFSMDLYQQILNTSDYLLYTGDEDSLAQSQVDAKNAGLRIISRPNPDLEIELPFNNQKELNKIFADFEKNEVKDWTWENYTLKHLKIWKENCV